MAARDRILKALRHEPGLSKSDLRRRLGSGWGSLGYHLNILAREGRVVRERDGNALRLFPGDVGAAEAKWLALLARPVSREILERLQEGSAGVRELSRDLGRSRGAIRTHLGRLEAEGLVRTGTRNELGAAWNVGRAEFLLRPDGGPDGYPTNHNP